jgi:hypothetical protein
MGHEHPSAENGPHDADFANQQPTKKEEPMTTEDSAALMVLQRAKTRYGFLTDVDAAVLAASQQFQRMQVVVRCGSCRFTCAAMDVARLVALVESGMHHGQHEYVRDVSLTASVEEIVDEIKRAEDLTEGVSYLNAGGLHADDV